MAVAVLEDDVAGLGVRGRAQLVLHCVGESGQLDAVLSENPRGEAGAVPCTEGLAAPNVCATQTAHCGCNDCVAGCVTGGSGGSCGSSGCRSCNGCNVSLLCLSLGCYVGGLNCGCSGCLCCCGSNVGLLSLSLGCNVGGCGGVVAGVVELVVGVVVGQISCSGDLCKCVRGNGRAEQDCACCEGCTCGTYDLLSHW